MMGLLASRRGLKIRKFLQLISFLLCLTLGVSTAISQEQPLQWSQDIRLTFDPSSSEYPRIAVDSNNNVHIVWQDWRDGNPQVYYTKLKNDGETLVDDKRVTDDSASSWDPALAIDHEDNILVVWDDWRDGYSGQIYFTKLNNNGEKMLGDKQVSNTQEWVDNPDINIDLNDKIHVTWQQKVPVPPPFSTSIYQIFYTKLDNAPGSEGFNLLPILRVTNEIPNHYYGAYDPAIVTDQANNAHIIWDDLRTSYTEREIFYTKLDINGNITIDDQRISYDTVVSEYPRIARDSNDFLHLVWENFISEEQGNEIYYIKLDSNGNSVTGAKEVASGRNPTIGIDSHNNIHIAWSGLYYTRLDNNGNTLIPPTHLTGSEWTAIEPDIVIDSDDNIHIAWQDNREGNWEIYYKTTAKAEQTEYWAVIVGAGKDEATKYANDDAINLFNALLSSSNWKAENIHLLVGSEATEHNIEDAITKRDWAAKDIAPDDLFIFYFAGHGTAEWDPQDEDDGYWGRIRPYDDTETQDRSIDDFELTEWLANLPTKNSIVILDACHSGAFVGNIGKDGRIILTVAGPEEESGAHPHFEHFLFSFYILQGVRGAADSNGDGTITIKELFDFAEPRVIEASKVTGVKPHPMMSGADIDVLVLDAGYIQQKVNSAQPGDTVNIPSGTYQEHIIIRKPLKLIGQNAILDASSAFGGIFINTSDVEIRGFTLGNGNYGIYLDNSSDNMISENHASDNTHGIYLFSSSFNEIVKNVILFSDKAKGTSGMTLLSSHYNLVHDNTFDSRHTGITLELSEKNTLKGNDIADNFIGIVALSGENKFYHNVLVDNSVKQAYDYEPSIWDNGYPSGGNYWSDFDEPAEGAHDEKHGPNQDIVGPDGIIDTPYTKIGGNTGAEDRYPLLHPKSNLINFTRSLPSEVGLGEVFTVTVTIEAKADLLAVIGEDTLPEGLSLVGGNPRFVRLDVAAGDIITNTYQLKALSPGASIIQGIATAVLSTDSQNAYLDSYVFVTSPAVFRVTKGGDVYADRAYYGADFLTGGADIAEFINVSEPVEPGDVIELDPDRPSYYRKSRSPYSILVAGVISSTPGITMGQMPESPATTSLPQMVLSNLNLDSAMLSERSPISLSTSPDNSLPLTFDISLSQLLNYLPALMEAENKPLLALMGVVPVKATTENGPIHPGDLLTTSSTPGYAMRCDDPRECEGAIIGKALEPLGEGIGVIKMLVMR